MNRVAKQYVLPYLWITLASAVYAVGFNWCYEPNQIGFGGITGVGQIINHILPWAPIGTVVIILNIPPVPAGVEAAGRAPAGVLPLLHVHLLHFHRHSPHDPHL